MWTRRRVFSTSYMTVRAFTAHLLSHLFWYHAEDPVFTNFFSEDIAIHVRPPENNQQPVHLSFPSYRLKKLSSAQQQHFNNIATTRK